MTARSRLSEAKSVVARLPFSRPGFSEDESPPANRKDMTTPDCLIINKIDELPVYHPRDKHLRQPGTGQDMQVLDRIQSQRSALIRRSFGATDIST